MTFTPIDDPADPRLEPYRLIRDRDSQAAGSRAGLFIGETAVVIQAMLREPGRTVSILASDRHEARVREMIAEAAGAGAAAGAAAAMPPDVYLVPDRIVEPLTGFNLHRGLLAVGRRPAPRSLASIVPPAAQGALLLCVEAVNNIDNIGQLFRVAAAFGCCGVLLSPDCHDPLYRKSLRVSCGCALVVPHSRSANWHEDLRALHATHGFTVIGATGGGDMTLDQLAAKPTHTAARTALVVGAEFHGLSGPTLENCQARVRIPMAPGVDSLNVAVAAAVFLSRLAGSLQR